MHSVNNVVEGILKVEILRSYSQSFHLLISYGTEYNLGNCSLVFNKAVKSMSVNNEADAKSLHAFKTGVG